MTSKHTAWRVLAESVIAAVAVYLAAGALEETAIRAIHPTEFELAWVSDVLLSVAFGFAVYLWRHLAATRRELSERERAELVIRTQLSVAAEVQRRYLPSVPPAVNGYDWAAELVTAGEIGGDFYDFVQQGPGTWLVLVADVSGKGIPAAMALGLLRSTFRTLAREGHEPARLVERFSATLHDEWLGSPYVTCFAGRFETEGHRLTYTNAGHPAGLIVGAGDTRSLDRGGPPAGMLPAVRYDQEAVDLRAGDVCVIVTDGVTEALEGDARPLPEVVSSSARQGTGSARDICRALAARAEQGRGPVGVEQWEDDRTVVVITVRGTQIPLEPAAHREVSC